MQSQVTTQSSAASKEDYLASQCTTFSALQKQIKDGQFGTFTKISSAKLNDKYGKTRLHLVLSAPSGWKRDIDLMCSIDTTPQPKTSTETPSNVTLYVNNKSIEHWAEKLKDMSEASDRKKQLHSFVSAELANIISLDADTDETKSVE